jgi:hypothetical protein
MNSARWCGSLAALLGVACLGSDAAAEASRNTRAGLLGSSGIGTQYGGFGVQLGYLLPVAQSRWSLFGGAGLGWLGTEDGRRTVWGNDITYWSGSLVLGGSWGFRHRLAGVAGVGPTAFQWVAVENLVVEGRFRPGPFAELGYEFLGSTGLLWRVMLGMAYAPYAWVARDNRWHASASVGFGWKPW